MNKERTSLYTYLKIIIGQLNAVVFTYLRNRYVKMNLATFLGVMVVVMLIIPSNAIALTIHAFNSFDQWAKDELALAKSNWELYCADNVDIYLSMAWGSIGKNIAQTRMKLIPMSYSFMRDRMIADEEQELSRNGLIRFLPKLDEFSVDFSPLVAKDNLVIWVTQAQWKALGLTKDDYHPNNNHCDQWGNCWNKSHDADIIFNPDYFSEDIWSEDNPRNYRDLEYIATHELGHVLGFNSAHDMKAEDFEGVGKLQLAGPTALDMYRFKASSDDFKDPNLWPTTLEEFRTDVRNIKQEDSVQSLFMDYDEIENWFIKAPMQDWDTVKQLGGGHWLDRISRSELGVMDPGSDSHYDYSTDIIKIPDVYAMDLIGWDIPKDIYDNKVQHALPWTTANYSPKAASKLAEEIENPSMLHGNSNDAIASICDIIDCTGLTDREKAERAYLENPILMMAAFRADVQRTIEDPDYSMGSLPWEADLMEYDGTFIHEDVLIPTASESIPTLSEWGMIIFLTIIMGLGVVTLFRRRIE